MRRSSTMATSGHDPAADTLRSSLPTAHRPLPTVPAFRLSTYLTLGFACAALGYAEASLFPEVGAFAVAAVVALRLR